MIEHDNYIIIIDNLQLQSQLHPCQKIIPAQWGPIPHPGQYFSILDVKPPLRKIVSYPINALLKIYIGYFTNSDPFTP